MTGTYASEEEDMAEVLVDERVDLNDAMAVDKALIAAGFGTNSITALRDKAVAEARYLIASAASSN